MKTTKYILLTAVGMLLIGGSCSETYDIYPEEYSKVVRLKSSGAQEITVYSPHAVTVCPVTVQKGGWNPETDATATLRIMTEAEFNDYLLESGAGYSYIPSSCYSFSDGTGATQTTVSFNGDVRYQTVNLNLYPPKIGEFLETYTDASRTPVIPVILESQDAGIDMESRELFIMPNYAEPSVGFQNGGLQVLPDGTDSYQLKIGFPFTSEWDVNCKIEVDPSALDAYNKANGTSYGLMPEGSYSGVGDVKIANGEEYATLDIKLDLVKALFRNALPLRITSIDADGFTISETPAVIAIDNAAGYKINLTADDISSNDVYENDGAGIPGLVDGDLNTYCHGYYWTRDLSEPFGAWIQIQLPEEASQVALDIYNRRSYNNGHIKRVQLMASNPETGEWEIFSDSNAYENVLTDKESVGYFGSFQAPFKFKSFVMRIYEADGGNLIGNTSAFWSMGDIVVYAK